MSRSAMVRTAADYLIERIVENGTRHIFGVGGANIEDVYDAIDRFGSGVTGVLAKHEFGAATMADGYSRTTNQLGVVVATSGGGALNLVAALGESFDSRVPVLALIGQPAQQLEGVGAFQDTSGVAGTIDARALFAQVSRYCAKVTSVDELPVVLGDAIAAANSGGPAIILLPKDIQQSSMMSNVMEPRCLDSVVGEPFDEIDDAVRLVRAAARGSTVIIAGSEVARCDARFELESLAVALDASVVVAPDAKDVFRNSHAQFAGVVGIMGHPDVPELISDADFAIVVGTPLPLTARAGIEAALALTRVVHIGSSAPFIDTEFSIGAPLQKVLAALAAAVGCPPSRGVRDRNSLRPLQVPSRSGPGLRYCDAISAIAAHLDAETDIFADAGNTGAAVVHHLPVPDGGRFVVALGMGGMGYSFGAAIGSAMGRGRRTFVIAGDGAFYMHGLEVHTAVEYNLPVTFIIFNNNAHAMCVAREQLYYSGKYTFNRFGRAQIGESIAALFPAVAAHSATTLAEFQLALAATASVAGPVFVSVECDPDEIPPFIPFLKELNR